MNLIHSMFVNLYKMYKASKKSKRFRRWKIRPINRNWAEFGYFQKQFLAIKDMDSEQRIGLDERLSLTLLYLAHGVSLQSIAWSYKLGKTTVRNIVLETCELLWNLLSPIYVSEPTETQYKDIAADFKRMRDMPNCVAAIDGKHISIKCPSNSGSLFYNYKKFFSVVLMATCDAKYTFTSISVGSYGSQSDGGIFHTSAFGQALISNKLPLPLNIPLSTESSEPFPHFFVGDAAFPLKNNLMRPYPGAHLNRTKRIFNYRLSRARRVIENSFGILTARWRVLRNIIECAPDNCEKIFLGCVALHNFIMLNDAQRWYCPDSYVDWEGSNNSLNKGNWRNDLDNVGGPLSSIRTFARRAPVSAFQLRDTLSQYFVNEGSISFQDEIDIAIHGPY